jgi:5-carboxymethyl-2-hydroxymuconate isomerase
MRYAWDEKNVNVLTNGPPRRPPGAVRLSTSVRTGGDSVPHFIMEYTANLKEDINIPALLRQVNETLLAQGGVYPIGGIRARAIELKDYCIADGDPRYGFVHATLKIGAGRSAEVKDKTCADLFALLKSHLFPPGSQRPCALSLELYEFAEEGTYRYNTLHAHLKSAAK